MGNDDLLRPADTSSWSRGGFKSFINFKSNSSDDTDVDPRTIIFGAGVILNVCEESLSVFIILLVGISLMFVWRFFLLSVVRMTKLRFVIGEFCSH